MMGWMGKSGARWRSIERAAHSAWPWPLRVRGTIESIEDAEAMFEDYVDDLNARGDDLALIDVIEFRHSFYAIAAENSTGIGAIELIIDRGDDRVRPEPGPNMAWNARGGGTMSITPDEAREIARRHLDENLSGREAARPDTFYGYYTLRFMRGGRIEGILSVHGNTGEVWHHHWHDRFLSRWGHRNTSENVSC
ncbi:MAG: hypothetical protein ACOX9A_01725 [Anaerolineae bacterium]|jgi:hypothetical protein